MICKQCMDAADNGGATFNTETGEITIYPHCQDSGCDCQHKDIGEAW